MINSNPPTPPGSSGCESPAGRPPVVPHCGIQRSCNPPPSRANSARAPEVAVEVGLATPGRSKGPCGTTFCYSQSEIYDIGTKILLLQ